ncbi:MAG: hypothetical protein M3Q22_01320 [Actinomycetota bacterium]|nr:hypothetical protein [Actinomycetota bacterium]
MIATDSFLSLARAIAKQEGFENLPVVTIPHPIGGREPAALDESLARAVDAVADALLTSLEAEAVTAVSVAVHDAPADVSDFLAFAEGRRWSDGLPMVPPTEELVARAVAATGRDAGELLGLVPPANRGATVGAVAANAVMAGCLPEVMPVVVAAVQAVLEPRFNLQALTTTTHPVTPLVIVHGPVVEELGFNGGPNVFGQGNRANAGVGRALRLVLQNIGQARPGETDRATHGTPGKYAYCIAENTAGSPFPTFHEDRGGGARGAVTVLGGEGPHNINDHGSTDAAGLLTQIAGTLANLGHNNLYLRGQLLLVLGPEHAEVFARDGYDRRGIQEAVFAHPRARISMAGVSEGNLDRYRRTAPHVYGDLPADGVVPMLDSPESLLVLVAGGPGKHSMLVPTFGTTEAVTVDVLPAGAHG